MRRLRACSNPVSCRELSAGASSTQLMLARGPTHLNCGSRSAVKVVEKPLIGLFEHLLVDAIPWKAQAELVADVRPAEHLANDVGVDAMDLASAA